MEGTCELECTELNTRLVSTSGIPIQEVMRGETFASPTANNMALLTKTTALKYSLALYRFTSPYIKIYADKANSYGYGDGDGDGDRDEIVHCQ